MKNKTIFYKLKLGDKHPATIKGTEELSKDLKKRAFKFVRPTIVCAHMQSTGMANDHLATCFRYKQV